MNKYLIAILLIVSLMLTILCWLAFNYRNDSYKKNIEPFIICEQLPKLKKSDIKQFCFEGTILLIINEKTKAPYWFKTDIACKGN